MLQDFRDNLKGTAVFIVVLISIPFALVGIDQIFQGGGASQAELSVNGDDISKLDVDRALSSHKQRLLSQYQGLDPALLDDELLRKPVQERLAREKVISLQALAGGMGVGKGVFSDILKNTEAFQVDGRFDRDSYDFMLRQMGYTQKTYFAALKDDILISQMASGLAGTGMVTGEELELTAALIEQKRDYYYLTVSIDELAEAIVIKDSQIDDYYRDHQQDFQTKEQVVIDYVALGVDDLIASVLVEEGLVLEQFNAQASAREATARSRIEHILFTNDDAITNEERVKEVQKKLADGQLFGDLAREYSADMGSAEQGGDLGFVELATFPPAFSEAVANLDVGEVSAPLQTDSGVHLIHLAEKESLETFEYEQEKDRIRLDLERQLAEQLLPEKIEELRELAYNAESLLEVADEMGLAPMTTQPFSRAGGEDMSAFPKVIKAAFDPEVLSEGHASDVIELSTTRVVIIKLRELIPVRTMALDEVRSQVVETLTGEQAQKLVEQKGREILAQAKAGIDIETLAKQEGLPWQVSIDTRGFGGIVDTVIRDRAFEQPARSPLPQVTGFLSDEGDYIVLALTRVVAGELDNISPEQNASLLSSIRTNLAQREFKAYENSLFAEADIVGLY